jgi:hypothetical protein
VNGETPSVPVNYVYDQTNGGNGKTYILEQGPVLGTRQTVFNLLGQHPEFSRFRELLEGSDLLETIHDGRFACSDTCISVFNNFHYTIYVPTNESIDALIAQKKLATWDDVAQLDTMIYEQNLLYKQYTQQINDFLRYHIQDNALFIGADNTMGNNDISADASAGIDYETASINRESKTFNKLTVFTDKQGSFLHIKDKAGNTRKVLTDRPGLYNIMAREYTYQNADKSSARIIHNSSSAVIHLIDEPLFIEN